MQGVWRAMLLIVIAAAFSTGCRYGSSTYRLVLLLLECGCFRHLLRVCSVFLLLCGMGRERRERVCSRKQDVYKNYGVLLYVLCIYEKLCVVSFTVFLSFWHLRFISLSSTNFVLNIVSFIFCNLIHWRNETISSLI